MSCYNEPCQRRWVFSCLSCLFFPLTLQAWIIPTYSVNQVQPHCLQLQPEWGAFSSNIPSMQPACFRAMPGLITENITMLQIKPVSKDTSLSFPSRLFFPQQPEQSRKIWQGVSYAKGKHGRSACATPAWQTGLPSLLFKLLEALTRWTGHKYSSKKFTL